MLKQRQGSLKPTAGAGLREPRNRERSKPFQVEKNKGYGIVENVKSKSKLTF